MAYRNTLAYLPDYIARKIFTYVQQEILSVSVLMELTLNSIINMSSLEPSSSHSMLYMLLSWSLHLLRYVYSDQVKVVINSKVGGVEKPGSYVYVQFQSTTEEVWKVILINSKMADHDGCRRAAWTNLNIVHRKNSEICQ